MSELRPCERCGACSWPAACGAFDEAFHKLAEKLKKELESDLGPNKLPMIGLSEWIPSDD